MGIFKFHATVALLLCVKLCRGQSVNVFELENAVGGAGKNRSPWRSEASGSSSLHMFKGDMLTIDLCLTEPSSVTISGLDYSNDGQSDLLSFAIDNNPLATVNTVKTNDGWGKHWNIYKSSGHIGTDMKLGAGKHTLSITVNDADCHGTEFDALTIGVDTNIDKNTLFCGSSLFPSADPSPCAVAIDSPTTTSAPSTSTIANTPVNLQDTSSVTITKQTTPTPASTSTSSNSLATSPATLTTVTTARVTTAATPPDTSSSGSVETMTTASQTTKSSSSSQSTSSKSPSSESTSSESLGSSETKTTASSGTTASSSQSSSSESLGSSETKTTASSGTTASSSQSSSSESLGSSETKTTASSGTTASSSQSSSSESLGSGETKTTPSPSTTASSSQSSSSESLGSSETKTTASSVTTASLSQSSSSESLGSSETKTTASSGTTGSSSQSSSSESLGSGETKTTASPSTTALSSQSSSSKSLGSSETKTTASSGTTASSSQSSSSESLGSGETKTTASPSTTASSSQSSSSESLGSSETKTTASSGTTASSSQSSSSESLGSSETKTTASSGTTASSSQSSSSESLGSSETKTTASSGTTASSSQSSSSLGLGETKPTPSSSVATTSVPSTASVTSVTSVSTHSFTTARTTPTTTATIASSTSIQTETTPTVAVPSSIISTSTTSVSTPTTQTVQTTPITKPLVEQRSFTSDCLEDTNVNILFRPVSLVNTQLIARELPRALRRRSAPGPNLGLTCDTLIWQIDYHQLGRPVNSSSPVIDHDVNIATTNRVPFPASINPVVTKEVVLRYIVPERVNIKRGRLLFTLQLTGVTQKMRVGIQYINRAKRTPSKILYATFKPNKQSVTWQIPARSVSPSLENVLKLVLQHASDTVNIDFLKLEYKKADVRTRSKVIGSVPKWKVRGDLIVRSNVPAGMEVVLNGQKQAGTFTQCTIIKKPNFALLSVNANGELYVAHKSRRGKRVGSRDEDNTQPTGQILKDVSGFTLGSTDRHIARADINTDTSQVTLTYDDGNVVKLSYEYSRVRSKVIVTSSTLPSDVLHFFSTYISEDLAAVNTMVVDKQLTGPVNIMSNAIGGNSGQRFTFTKSTANPKLRANDEIEVILP